MFEACDKANLSAYGHSDENEDIVIITAISCSLSIVGAFGIFWTYYKIREIRLFVRKILVLLTVADLLTASGYMVAAIRHFSKFKESLSCKLCIVQSFITTYSSLVSFFLTMVIALHIFLTVYNKRPVTGSRGFMILFNGISWLVPACIVITALVTNTLGQGVTSSVTSQVGTGPWCWIQTNGTLTQGNIAWMFVSGKGWEITCYLVTTSLYVLLKLRLHLQHNNEQLQRIHNSLRHEDKNFLLVFLVLYAIRIWGTLRFFMFVYAPDKSSGAMQILQKIQAFGDPSQAFFNFLLFCVFDKTVRRHMFACFHVTNGNAENEPLVQAGARGYGSGCEIDEQPSPSRVSINSDADIQ